MKKWMLVGLALSFCMHSMVSGQRVLEDVFYQPFPYYGLSHNGAIVNNQVFVAGNTSLMRFDGTSVTEFPYPVRDGHQLEISAFYAGSNIETYTLEHDQSLPVLGSVIYLTLENVHSGACVEDPVRHCPRYLYQFADGAITPSPITDQTLSNAVAFQDALYVVTSSGGVARLLRYDGTSVTEILPSLESHYIPALFSTPDYLYLVLNIGFTNTEVKVTRFDGAGFVDLPSFNLPHFYVREVHQVEGTQDTYFHSELDITHFDGVGMTEIAAVGSEPVDFNNFALFGGVAYFGTIDLLGGGELFRYDGAVAPFLLPDEAEFVACDQCLLNYQGRLYIIGRTAEAGNIVYAYDGTAFTTFATRGDETEFFNGLYEREGKLVITSNKMGYEFVDGSLNCTIETLSAPKINLTTNNFHMWGLGVRDGDDLIVKYASERKVRCSSSGAVPAPLAELEHVDIRLIGYERGWCWSEIVIDWEIAPACSTPPFCLNPEFEVSMSRAGKKPKDKFEFNYRFSEPSSIAFPLKDNKLYDFSLAMYDGQSFTDVISVDDALVPLGIASIGLTMSPKTGELNVSLETDEDKPVPFRMTLFDEAGKMLWEEQFEAPMNKLVSPVLDQPGSTLRFSAITAQPFVSEMMPIVQYFPNPFAGKLEIEINEAPAVVSLFSLRGELIHRRKLQTAGAYTIDVNPNKNGLYILSILFAGQEVRELVELRN